LFFSSRRRHTSCYRDWSSDVCSSDLYKHKDIMVRGEQREVVAGNGGAPFDPGWQNPFYGYVLVERQADDRVSVTAYKTEPGMDRSEERRVGKEERYTVAR